MKRATLLATLLVLSACGSPRTDFYTLSVVGAPADPVAGTGCRQPLIVSRVLLPGILDRQSMVSSAGGGRLDISGQARWAAPLDQMIQGVLTEDLRRRLPPGRVLAPGDPQPEDGAARIAVNVLRFMPEADDTATLRADWTLFDSENKVVRTRSHSLTVPQSGDPGAAVRAMSRLIGQLADVIVASLAGC